MRAVDARAVTTTKATTTRERASRASRARSTRGRATKPARDERGGRRGRGGALEAAAERAERSENEIFSVARAPACELLSNENGAYTVRGEMTLRGVAASSVYNLLTDYEASPRAFRAVRSVRVIEGEGDACVASNIYIEQECEWKFFVFGGAFPCAFEVEERDEEMKMKCSLAPGRRGTGFLKQFEGSWSVENTSEGVLIEHTLMVKPKLTPPYASKIFVQQVEQILEDVVNEIETWNGVVYGKPPHRQGVDASIIY